jgi:cyclopropane fatty-acyl-phospholipid synthase-like methyltransferase
MTRSAPSLADFECTERKNELSCQHYDQHFDAVATQSLTALLDAADVSKGRGRLDLFTGAALADGPSTERCAQAIGVDLSAAQVKLVREIHQKLRRFDSKVQQFKLAHQVRVALMQLPYPAFAVRRICNCCVVSFLPDSDQ